MDLHTPEMIADNKPEAPGSSNSLWLRTGFFQDPDQFEYLFQEILPRLVRDAGTGIRSRLMAWCLGCGTGEEPYSVAMVLQEFADRFPGLPFQFTVLGTDPSEERLEQARLAIYDWQKGQQLPLPVRNRYLLKSKDPQQQRIRIIPQLRSMVRFRCLSLAEEASGFREPMDLIFCRGVISQLEPPDQVPVLSRVCRLITPGGYLFLRRDEAPPGSVPGLHSVTAGIYQYQP